MYYGTQGIAPCSHRERTSSKNKGNSLQLTKHDLIIHDRLNNGPQNAQCTLHGIQNHLLHILGNRVRNGLCQPVRSAGVFSILVDEMKDFA